MLAHLTKMAKKNWFQHPRTRKADIHFNFDNYYHNDMRIHDITGAFCG